MPGGFGRSVEGFATSEALVGDIIIPAHNEAAVLGRCLDALEPDAFDANVRVIVACNGCTDRTASIARARGVEVVELPVASKTAAIRAAERESRPVPRVYLDADVELAHGAACSMLQHLGTGCEASRPAIEYETEHCAWSVRHYYRARQGIPSVMRRLWGAGVYGLSPEGRARFADYPDVIAEDYWVDLHFADADICILTDCPPVRVYAPRRASDLRRAYRPGSRRRGRGRWWSCRPVAAASEHPRRQAA